MFATKEQVKKNTIELRTSKGSPFSQLRKLLLDKSLKLDDLALTTLWPEDHHVYCGYILNRTDEIFFFEFSYRGMEVVMRKWEPRIESDIGIFKKDLMAAREYLSQS